MRSPRTRKDSMAMMQNKATPAIMLGNTASTTINRLFQRAISNAFFHQVIMIFPGLTSAGAGLEVAKFVTLVRREWSIAKQRTRNAEHGLRNTEHGIRNTEYGIRGWQSE